MLQEERTGSEYAGLISNLSRFQQATSAGGFPPNCSREAFCPGDWSEMMHDSGNELFVRLWGKKSTNLWNLTVEIRRSELIFTLSVQSKTSCVSGKCAPETEGNRNVLVEKMPAAAEGAIGRSMMGNLICFPGFDGCRAKVTWCSG